MKKVLLIATTPIAFMFLVVVIFSWYWTKDNKGVSEKDIQNSSLAVSHDFKVKGTVKGLDAEKNLLTIERDKEELTFFVSPAAKIYSWTLKDDMLFPTQIALASIKEEKSIEATLREKEGRVFEAVEIHVFDYGK